MSRRLGRTGEGEKPKIRLDDNVGSYDVLRDGRGPAGRLQQARLDRIEASPFQVRRVFPEREIEELAESIRANGLIHEPKGRPHPNKAGWVELMPGEMRVRALKRLVETGQAEDVLERDAEGNWLVPIKVEPVEDERAEAMVLSENLDRTDLSAWEWVLAWQQRRDSLKRRQQPATVRDVAASLGKRFQLVGEYLQVADALTLEVLLAAGVVSSGEPDHRRMAQLSLAALQRVRRAAEGGVQAGADRLLQELHRAGDSAAGSELARRQSRERRLRVRHGGFQVNIRSPLEQLEPAQAGRYLSRMIPAVGTLAERAATELPTEEAEFLARALEVAAERLRTG